MCWVAPLSKQSEQFSLSLGASDGTPQNSNPAIASVKMNLDSIKESLCKIFNSTVFKDYSLYQINEYLDSLPASKPLLIQIDQDSDECAAVSLCNPINLDFDTIVITSNHEFVDEQRNRYDFDSPFAMAVIRSITFSRPYILYKNAVYGIMGVSETTFLKRIIYHTHTLNCANGYKDVWIYRLKRPCHPPANGECHCLCCFRSCLSRGTH